MPRRSASPIRFSLLAKRLSTRLGGQTTLKPSSCPRKRKLGLSRRGARPGMDHVAVRTRRPSSKIQEGHQCSSQFGLGVGVAKGRQFDQELAGLHLAKLFLHEGLNSFPLELLAMKSGNRPGPQDEGLRAARGLPFGHLQTHG